MSATIAAALKKIAVAILTEPKVLKTIGGIILGVLIIIFMPIGAILAMCNGDIEIDVERYQELVEANLSDSQRDELYMIQQMMADIDDAMDEAELTNKQTKAAQVLYTLALSEHAGDEDFIDRLVGCFEEDQDYDDLIDAVNDEFGTDLDDGDLENVMNSIRGKYIDISDYEDPSTKNNRDLVQWAKYAADEGWGYVYGTYGSRLTGWLYQSKLNQYPIQVGQYADFIQTNWMGKRVADCVGLIKGYSWLDVDALEVNYCINGMPDIDANQMYQYAPQSGTIDTIPEIPGLAVWHQGHIGIYIGNGKVIEAKGTEYGVVETDLADGAWTHWLQIPFITYLDAIPEETEPPTETTQPPTESITPTQQEE